MPSDSLPPNLLADLLPGRSLFTPHPSHPPPLTPTLNLTLTSHLLNACLGPYTIVLDRTQGLNPGLNPRSSSVGVIPHT